MTYKVGFLPRGMKIKPRKCGKAVQDPENALVIVALEPYESALADVPCEPYEATVSHLRTREFLCWTVSTLSLRGAVSVPSALVFFAAGAWEGVGS